MWRMDQKNESKIIQISTLGVWLVKILTEYILTPILWHQLSVVQFSSDTNYPEAEHTPLVKVSVT